MVAGYLAAVADDLDAARRLAVPHANRLAAYHVQPAAEKLVKAVLVQRRIHPGVEHRIDVLVHMLEPSDPWQPLLDPLDRVHAVCDDVPVSELDRSLEGGAQHV